MNINLSQLLADNLPTEYKDKVFWYASRVAIKKDNFIDIHIDGKENLVAFDTIAKQLEIKSISDIAKLGKSNSINNHPVLVSSGVFLWINDKLLVTQRTADTKFDPLYWTTPAGRCDLTPLQTGYKESSEEITGYSKKTDEIWMPKPTLPYLANTQIHSYDVIEKFPENIGLNTTTINTWIDDTLIESYQMWYYYSPDVNTLELRLPMYANIDEELYFKNNEFDTNVALKDIKELENMDVVPAVAKLIKEIRNE